MFCSGSKLKHRNIAFEGNVKNKHSSKVSKISMRKKRLKYKQNIKVEVIQKTSHDINKERSTNMIQIGKLQKTD